MPKLQHRPPSNTQHVQSHGCAENTVLFLALHIYNCIYFCVLCSLVKKIIQFLLHLSQIAFCETRSKVTDPYVAVK